MSAILNSLIRSSEQLIEPAAPRGSNPGLNQPLTPALANTIDTILSANDELPPLADVASSIFARHFPRGFDPTQMTMNQAQVLAQPARAPVPAPAAESGWVQFPNEVIPRQPRDDFKTWTYTRCQEDVRPAAGGFAPAGLHVNNDIYDDALPVQEQLSFGLLPVRISALRELADLFAVERETEYQKSQAFTSQRRS